MLRYAKQLEQFETWVSEVVLPYLETASRKSLQVAYAAEIVREEEIRKVVFSDGTFAFGSFFFIIAASVFHMKSVAIPLAGVFTIAMSVPFAFAAFRLVFERFSIINVVAFYLILGIGADNLFIFASYSGLF